MTKILKILLTLTFFKGLIWAYLIPPFQSPDEQNHFAYTQYIAETKKAPNIKESKNASLELMTATKILNFDWSGSHPMWSKEIFTKAKLKEKEIESIPTSDKKIFVSYANGYKNPPLYYILGSIFYKIGSLGTILDRLFMVRVLSVIFAVIAVFFSYKIAYFVTNNNLLSLTSASLVSFQPSFTNITSTVTNDSMAIASVTIAIYLILKQNTLELLGGFIALSTRVHLGILLIYSLFRQNLLILTALILLLFFISPSNPPYLPFGIDKFVEASAAIRNILINQNVFPVFASFLRISIPHYLNEVFPWYFGVFGWLEITLPPIIYTIFKILILISVVGFLLKRNNPYPKITPGVICILLLFLVIFVFDFITFAQTGEGVGVQGRHLIPGISIHALLLLIGLELLIPKKLKKFGMKLLILFMIFTNFVAIYQIVNYFYTIDSSILEKIALFKPTLININIFFALFALFMLTLLIFLINMSKLKEDEKNS